MMPGELGQSCIPAEGRSPLPGVGGSTGWKLGAGAAELVTQATEHRISARLGRAGSRTRYAYAARIGCVWVDGRFLTYAADRNLAVLRGWLAERPAAMPAAGTGAPGTGAPGTGAPGTGAPGTGVAR